MKARGEIKKLGPWVYFISLAVENWYNKAVFINVLFSGMIHDLPDCRGFSKVGPRDRLDLLQGLPREKTTTTHKHNKNTLNRNTSVQLSWELIAKSLILSPTVQPCLSSS